MLPHKSSNANGSRNILYYNFAGSTTNLKASVQSNINPQTNDSSSKESSAIMLSNLDFMIQSRPGTTKNEFKPMSRGKS